MHIFLTGPIQVGKTSVIEKSLPLLGNPLLGGFRTVSIPSQLPRARAEVYVIPAQGEAIYDRAHLLGIRWGDDLFTAFPGAFEQGGLSILRNPAANARLLLMDELGMMEQKAPAFRRAVLQALDGPLPILGVLKPKAIPFLDAIRQHPAVQLLEVRPENRDELPRQVAALLRPQVCAS